MCTRRPANFAWIFLEYPCIYLVVHWIGLDPGENKEIISLIGPGHYRRAGGVLEFLRCAVSLYMQCLICQCLFAEKTTHC